MQIHVSNHFDNFLLNQGEEDHIFSFVKKTIFPDERNIKQISTLKCKKWNKDEVANSVDPDEEALHCLPSGL